MTLNISPPHCLLQIIPSLDAGGAERGCLDIAGAVHAQGGRALVASTGGRMAVELAGLGGELIVLPVASKNPLVMLANVFRLASLIRTQNIDLVHVRSRAPAWSAWAAAKITGVPFVTTFHGFYGAGNAFKRFYNSVMLRGARVIAGSHFMAAHIRATYHPSTDHIAVIARGVDVARFDPAAVAPERVAALRREWKIPGGMQIILLPARLTRWKGQLLFVAALARLYRKDVIGVLCGDAQGRDGYEQEIRAAARRYGIEAQLRITGNVADMPAAYSAAHIAVSASSDAEAFGRVPVEAMAMGCTIVAADHGGAAETLRSGDSGPAFGILFSPGDAAGLAAALAQALAAPRGGGPEQVAAARAHVLANYSTASMCAQTLALYRDVLPAAPAPARRGEAMKRILVIKLGALGDFVLAMGPFRAIRAHHPGAHITLLTTPAFAAMGAACGYFDTIWSHGRPAKIDLGGLWRLYRFLRGGAFEWVYDLQTSTRSCFYRNFMRQAKWSGIAAGCSHPHSNPKRDFMHTLDRQAEQLAMAGIARTPPADLSWAQVDLGRFNLPVAGKYVLLVPGGSAHRPEKRWPAQHYGELAAWLSQCGFLTIILGAGAERDLADEIEALCPSAVSFVDRTSFMEIIALARGAAWAIGNDTGPMHLIAAAGCPSVVLFSGASDPALCAPRGTNVTLLRRDPLAGLAISEVATHLNLL